MDTRVDVRDDVLGLRNYLDILLKRWWIVVITTLVAAGGALGTSLTSPPVYRAAATIVVQGEEPITPFIGFGQQQSIDTFIEIIKSRTIAERALQLLQVPEAQRQNALWQLSSGLTVSRTADIIRIEAEGPTPEAASSAANAVADAFLSWRIDQRRARARAVRRFVEGQLAAVSRELRESEDALVRYKVSSGQGSLSDQASAVVTKLSDFEAQQRAIAVDREVLETRLRQTREMLGKAASLPTSAAIADDPIVSSLRGELSKLEVDLALLREQLTDQHPEVIATKARLEAVKAQLQRKTAEVLAARAAAANQELLDQLAKLEGDRQVLQAKAMALDSIVRTYTREIRTLPPRETQLARLTRAVKVAEGTYLLLAQRLQEAKIEENTIVDNLRIVDRAIPPGAPVKPRTTRNTIFGVALGLVLGVAAAYLMEMLETTFQTPEEVERVLGLPVLGVIPFLQEPGRGKEIPLIGDGSRRAPFAEAFRHLRTNITYLSADRPVRRIAVTSPGPGEGKDTVSANLAIALAQLGKRVLLVDCDLRKPKLFWVFHPETPFGLTEMLVDGMSVDQVIHPTKVENLWFIPSGIVRPPNPADLLDSQKMRSFLQREDGGGDVLVLNTPPALPVADAAVLSPAVDGVLLVVRIGRTPREAARRARQQIESVGGRVVGVVVNGVPMPRRGRGYYYYSYYYDYGGKREEVKEPSR